MRTIVFIGSNKSGSSREAIRAAERMGYFTVLLTDRKTFVDQRLEFPDVHRMIHCDDLYDLDSLKKKIGVLQDQGKVIESIVSFVEPHVHDAAVLAEKYDLHRLSTKAVLKMSNKIKTREVLQNTSYSPYFAVYHPSDSLDSFLEEHANRLPMVVKSPFSTGSKDVLNAATVEELRGHIRKLSAKYPEEPVLVEAYLDGPQYLVEVLVHDGEAHLVAVIEQEILKQRRFIVTGYAVLAELPKSFQESLTKAVREIVQAMEIEMGPCHLELRHVDEEWKLIEINPRISGGAMNRMIELATGINLVQETLKLMLGKKPKLKRQSKKFVFTQYVTVSENGYLERVSGRKRASRMSGVAEVFVKPRKGHRLSVPESMGHRYAYVIAVGDSKEEAKQIARKAADEIRFSLTSGKWD